MVLKNGNRQGAKDAKKSIFCPARLNSRAKGFAIPLWNSALLISP
jgi:hypothetical protein